MHKSCRNESSALHEVESKDAKERLKQAEDRLIVGMERFMNQVIARKRRKKNLPPLPYRTFNETERTSLRQAIERNVDLAR